MSGRLFSSLRRKPGFIHLTTPLLDPSTGVVKYRLYTDDDPTFPSPTEVVTVTKLGLVDPDVAGPQNPIIPGNTVQILMKPSNYGLPDSDFFWLKLVYVDSADADMAIPAPSAATLILPPFVGDEQSGFNATAPNEPSIADSLQIDFPRQMTNLSIRNLSLTIPLYVAFQEGGPEIVIPALTESIGLGGMVSSIWVRGDGGTADFSARFTYADLATSTGGFTSADRLKLDGISAGAAALTSATPQDVGTTGAVGAATTAARADHVHAHGSQTDGTMHAVASETANGFVELGAAPIRAYDQACAAAGGVVVLYSFGSGLAVGQSRQFSVVVEAWTVADASIGGVATYGMIELYRGAGGLVMAPSAPAPYEYSMSAIGGVSALAINGTSVDITLDTTADCRANVTVIPNGPPRTRSTAAL